MSIIRTITLTEKGDIKVEGEYTAKDKSIYLDIAKKLVDEGINLINTPWIFSNRKFKDINELMETVLESQKETIDFLKKDVNTLSALKNLDFKKGIIELDERIPNEFIIHLFGRVPPFCILKIKRGKNTWSDLSAFIKDYLSDCSVSELKKLTAKYLEEECFKEKENIDEDRR